MRRFLSLAALIACLTLGLYLPVRAQIAPGVPPPRNVETSITASTTQSQGQQPLTADVNVVATVANDGDVVTAPPAIAGDGLSVFNEGVNTLQIFPVLGDDLGAGVDIAIEIEPNESREWVAFDTTTWGTEASTEIIHAEMVDNDNTDAFVIVDGGSEQQAYHSNGLVAGDLSGWTFDAGGGGTSFPIASIANSPGSGGSQAQITTTGSHLLVVGDIVSLANMSAGSNAGVHIVVGPVAATTFEIISANSTDATGTMDQAATLIAGVGSAGDYLVIWSATSIAVNNNDTFDFEVYIQATQDTTLNTRQTFGVGADFHSYGAVSIITIADGDHVSLMLNNDNSSSGNITKRDFAFVLVRL